MDIPSNHDGAAVDFAALDEAMRSRASRSAAHSAADVEGVQRLGRFVHRLRTRRRLSLESLARQTTLDWAWLALLEQGLLLPDELTSVRLQQLGRAFPLGPGGAEPDALFAVLGASLLHEALPDSETAVSGVTSVRPAESVGSRVVRWLSPLWHPPLAGDLVTAADTELEDQVFYLDEGSIQLSCRWRAATPSQPVSLWIAWSADLARPGEFRVRFLRRDDPDVLLGEQVLGPHLSGEITWSAADLGFDPTREPWAIALLLAEPPE